MKVLLLEDDVALSDILYDFLESKNFDVTLATDGQEALEYLVDEKFDLAILDINTPEITGMEVLKTIREYKNQTPVIMITAYQDTKHLKEAFSTGVDDYIKKPFDLDELEARISKLCRYFAINQLEEIVLDEKTIFIPLRCEIQKNGKKISIAQKECDILKYFCTHKNRAISNDELFQNIWNYEDMPTDATIRVYIKNLRELVGKEKIITIRGIGYRFEE